MEDKTDSFIIFEGGGAKGLAHAGALKAAEEKFRFIGVAGTSAGSIIAALVAAGYTADEIYSKDNPDSLFNINLTDLLDKQEWNDLRDVRDRFEGADANKRNGMWTAFHLFAVVLLFACSLGFASLTYFMEGFWLDRWLLRPLVAFVALAMMLLFFFRSFELHFLTFRLQCKNGDFYALCGEKRVFCQRRYSAAG